MKSAPLKTFIIYARADAHFKDELLAHLHLLVENEFIERWVDSDLLPGEDWEKRIEQELDAAHLVIMLVSADALRSEFIRKKELKTALEKKRGGNARVIPILVRDCMWEIHPQLSEIQLLPKDESGKIRGVAAWLSRDAAWTHCVRELKKLVDEIREGITKEAAEQARKDTLALEAAQQKEATEKAEKNRHRSDEATWKKVLAEAGKTEDPEQKIQCFEAYLDDDAHQNHREAAAEEIEALQADIAAARKVEAARQKREAAAHEAAALQKREAAFSEKYAAAQAFERAGRHSEAKTAFQETIDLHEPSFKVAVADLNVRIAACEKAIAEAARQKQEAAARAEALRKREVAFSEKYAAAQAFERAGRHSEAKTAFQETIDLHEPSFKVAVADLKDKIAACEKAIADAARQKQEAAARAEALRKREAAFSEKYAAALAFERAGRHSEAKAAFQETIDLHEPSFKVAVADLKAKIAACEKAIADAARQKQEAAERAEAERKRQAAEAERQKGLPDMVLIKGGTFQMGSNDYDDEKPIHPVTLSDFEIGKYPVTQKLWTDIMGSNPSYFKGADLPVETVSWEDVQDFLKKLNARHPGKNYRLPTEAEWEFAARGGTLSKGYTYAGSNDLKEVGWFSDNSDSKTHPVGQKKANELGIHDMSGNVWEWCADWYGEYKDSKQPIYNPTGPATGSVRVYRGGSWLNESTDCRVAYRLDWDLGDRYNSLGFRLARTY